MFGAYAHTEGEDDSVSASGTFDLASLVGSTKNHKRRLGSRNSSGSTVKVPMPVRMGGASCKKTLPTPTRRVTTEGGLSSVVSNLGSRLAAIDENTMKREEKAAHADVSLSDLMGGMGLATPSQHGIKFHSLLETKQPEESSATSADKENLGVSEKVSPDSGSFTMSSTKTRGVSSSAWKDYTGDFTDNLPAVSKPSTNTSIQGLSKPVKMMAPVKTGLGSRPAQRFPLPVRSKTVATDLKVDKSNDIISSRVEQPQPQLDTEKEKDKVLAQGPTITREQTTTSDIHQRLQALSGGVVGATGHLPDPPPSLSRAQTLPPGPSVHTVTPIKPPPVPADPTPRASVNMMPPPSSKDKVLTIRGKRYRVMKILGKGGSSRVYEAFDEEKSTVVAIKRVDLSDADDAQREGFINEINMLHKLQGLDRIVKLYDYENVVDEAEELLYVVMEKGDTDLAQLLKKYASNKELTPAMIKHYWAEMLHAVAQIHKNGIIHKDLKPANFMLVAGRLKLIDFGIASSIQSDKTSITIFNQMGTFNYMSPESIQDLGGPQMGNNKTPCIKISYKTDVWSLGCILYQLTFGKLPFADIKHPLMKLQAITNPDHVIEFPVKEARVEDERLVSVIRSCLEREARQRPGVEELLAHTYLTASAQAQARPVQASNPAVDAVKMLQALEGVLSPNTFKKTREGFRHLQMKD